MTRRTSGRYVGHSGLTSPIRLAGMAALLGLCACDAGRQRSDVETLVGVVEGSRTDTRLLLVRVDEQHGVRQADRRIACLIPADAEIYVNDRFADFSIFAVGDSVELLGRFDRKSREERFVVASANITRDEPPAPPLVIAPAAPPTEQPQEN